MQNHHKVLCAAVFLMPFLMPDPTLAIPARPKAPLQLYGDAFAQLSSVVDQAPGGLVQFETKDQLRFMSATNNSVTVQQPGTYLIIASPQVTATENGGCLDAWIVVNQKDVPNSGVRLCQANSGNTNVVVSQNVLSLKKGDAIQVKTSGKGAKLDYINPNAAPAIPSIILTILGLSYK